MARSSLPTLLCATLCLLAATLLLARADTASAPAETSRIVAIGGAVTEILYALDLGERVVAVDTSSTYPPQALKTKPNVGYIRALSPEGVLSAGPTLIIALEGAGPPASVQVLKAASVRFETIPEARDAAGVIANIQRVAALAGVTERGAALAQAVEQDFAALAALRARITSPREVAFVLSASGTAPVVGGAHTSADALFALAAVTNAMGRINGYKPAVDEAVLAADPYAILLMKDSNHAVADDAIAAMPAFAGSRAARDKRLYRMDGGYLLNFGPRTPQAARDLAALIYPELDLPALPEHPWTASLSP